MIDRKSVIFLWDLTPYFLAWSPSMIFYFESGYALTLLLLNSVGFPLPENDATLAGTLEYILWFIFPLLCYLFLRIMKLTAQLLCKVFSTKMVMIEEDTETKINEDSKSGSSQNLLNIQHQKKDPGFLRRLLLPPILCAIVHFRIINPHFVKDIMSLNNTEYNRTFGIPDSLFLWHGPLLNFKNISNPCNTTDSTVFKQFITQWNVRNDYLTQVNQWKAVSNDSDIPSNLQKLFSLKIEALEGKIAATNASLLQDFQKYETCFLQKIALNRRNITLYYCLTWILFNMFFSILQGLAVYYSHYLASTKNVGRIAFTTFFGSLSIYGTLLITLSYTITYYKMMLNALPQKLEI